MHYAFGTYMIFWIFTHYFMSMCSMLTTLERYQKCNYGAPEANVSTREALVLVIIPYPYFNLVLVNLTTQFDLFCDKAFSFCLFYLIYFCLSKKHTRGCGAASTSPNSCSHNPPLNHTSGDFFSRYIITCVNFFFAFFYISRYRNRKLWCHIVLSYIY